MFEFHEIKVKNDWMALTYRWQGQLIKRGGTCDVQWPDRTVTEDEAFIMEPYHTSYEDHGHRHSVHTAKAMVVVPHHGVVLKVDMDAKGMKFRNIKQVEPLEESVQVGALARVTALIAGYPKWASVIRWEPRKNNRVTLTLDIPEGTIVTLSLVDGKVVESKGFICATCELPLVTMADVEAHVAAGC